MLNFMSDVAAGDNTFCRYDGCITWIFGIGNGIGVELQSNIPLVVLNHKEEIDSFCKGTWTMIDYL